MSLEEASLTQVSKWGVVKQTTFYQLKVYQQLFFSLAFFQIIGFLIQLVSENGTNMSMDNYTLDFSYLDTLQVFIITALWLIYFTVKLASRKAAYLSVLVGNSLTHHYSNGLILLLISLFAAVTTVLLEMTFSLFVYLFKTSYFTDLQANYLLELTYLFLVYVFIASSAYLMTHLLKNMKLFVLLLLLLLVSVSMIPHFQPFSDLYAVIFKESNFFFFLLKISLLSLIIYLSSFVLRQKAEVGG